MGNFGINSTRFIDHFTRELNDFKSKINKRHQTGQAPAAVPEAAPRSGENLPPPPPPSSATDRTANENNKYYSANSLAGARIPPFNTRAWAGFTL